MELTPVSGFSKLSKLEKLDFLIENFLGNSNVSKETIKSFWLKDPERQKVFDEFSENTISNFLFPYGVVPNVLINNKLHMVPLVIEESSVVAAASKASKFWLDRGGFKTEVIGTEKNGQVHLIFNGDSHALKNVFEISKTELLNDIKPLVKNMESRGGGVKELKLIDKTNLEEGYYQLWADFETCDAMGANFINSILEQLGKSFSRVVQDELNEEVQIIMSILSNFTPDCVVRAWVECPVEDLQDKGHEMSAEVFASKFHQAVRIAHIDVNRATTHNKGVMNGIDAVVLATGNDFRAVEACAHTYAAKDGQYKSLTNCKIENGIFHFEIKIPLALGTVGGLTSLHPMAKMSLEMMNKPSASELMEITAVIGLAQNFGALRSLVTSGIQKGHMKMHLMNILNHFEANDSEREEVVRKMEGQVISYNSVRELLGSIRNYQ